MSVFYAKKQRDGNREVIASGTAGPTQLTTLREKLIKIGAKIVRHARYVTFQLAEVAVPRKLFQEILRRIARLKTKRLSLAPG